MPGRRKSLRVNSGFGGSYHTPSSIVSTTTFPLGLSFKEDSAEVKEPEDEKTSGNALAIQNAKPNEDTTSKKSKGQKGTGDPFKVATIVFEESSSSSDSSSEDEIKSEEKKMKLDMDIKLAKNKYKNLFNFQ